MNWNELKRTLIIEKRAAGGLIQANLLFLLFFYFLEGHVSITVTCIVFFVYLSFVAITAHPFSVILLLLFISNKRKTENRPFSVQLSALSLTLFTYYYCKTEAVSVHHLCCLFKYVFIL